MKQKTVNQTNNSILTPFMEDNTNSKTLTRYTAYGFYRYPKLTTSNYIRLHYI